MCTNWFEKFSLWDLRPPCKKWYGSSMYLCIKGTNRGHLFRDSENNILLFFFYYSSLKIPFLAFESECFMHMSLKHAKSVFSHVWFLNACITERLLYCSSLVNMWECAQNTLTCSSTSLIHNNKHDKALPSIPAYVYGHKNTQNSLTPTTHLSVLL